MVYVSTFVLGLTAMLSMKKYQLDRIRHALNPSLDPHGNGYIGVTIRGIITNAKSIGINENSKNIKDILPSINADFVLTNLIYTVGWLAFIALMALVLVFILKSIKTSLNQKGILGNLVSMSVVLTFIVQITFYLISNLGLIYIDSLGFPLISYGRTSLIINMFLIGIMLSVYKSKVLSSNEEKLIKRFRKNRFLHFLENKN